MLDPTTKEQRELWTYLTQELQSFLDRTSDYPVAPSLDQSEVRAFLQSDVLEAGVGTKAAIDHVILGMKNHTVHTTHPAYYGLFNPRANFPAILADTITATFNPQMAAWSHAPFAVEIERLLIQQLGDKFGYQTIDGVFATGGAEANQTALICALNSHFPNYATTGIAGIAGKPVLYCSTEAHHSVLKAARASGLGSEAIRPIPVDNFLAMDCNQLKINIEQDLKRGHKPFMVVGTFGTTGTGSIDPLLKIAQIVDNYGLWFHIDAAYGGALALTDIGKRHVAGISKSHSLTFDIHKWLAVPMGCSVFITNQDQILSQSFRTTTEYMPKDASDLDVVDPFTHSIQWSRRFIGLKLYLSLLTFGWNGYQEMINRTLNLGDYLREQLLAAKYKIHNHTVLPVVCFSAPESEKSSAEICQHIVNSGKSWLSIYPVDGTSTLRACINNHQTESSHIDDLVDLINQFAKTS